MLAGAIALAGFAVSAADDEIVVAVVGPMTGRYAAFGKAMAAGARWPLRSGSIDGRRVTLAVEDDACDRSKAVEVAKRLVERKVAVVIGHHCASASIAAAPIYAAAGIVMISPTTTDPQLTDKRAGPSIFRLAPRSDAEGPAIGTYMARAFAGKRIAILHDRTAAAIAITSAAKRSLNATGIKETLHTGFVAGMPDYVELARDLDVQNIDVVLLGAYPSEALLILKALSVHRPGAVVVGTTLVSGADFMRDLRTTPLLASCLIVPIMMVDSALGSVGDVIHPGYHPAAASQLTWDAVSVWYQAARSGTSLLQVLNNGTFNVGDVEFRFDKKGDATLEYFKMWTWKDGNTMVPAP